jgi:hypothetical protein
MTNSEGKAKPGAKPIIDEDSEVILYQGASLIQLAKIFKMDARDVKAKLHGTPVRSVGDRRGHPIFAIRDVAPYLVAPPYDIDEFIQKMTISDLPTILRKEYWAGMRSRQLYEKEAAELWPTSRVVDMVSSLFKTLRLSLLLSREAVERETELSVRQRAIIARIIDNTLEECHAATTRQFTAAQTAGSTAEFHASEELSSEEL